MDLTKALAKFRCLSHSLKIQKTRINKNVDLADSICERCNLGVVEDEFHFLLVCPFFKESRAKLIPKEFCLYPTMEKYVQLMSSQNANVLKGVAIYMKRHLYT